MTIYHLATLNEFPLGTIVFFIDPRTYNGNTSGITHVGLVVGNKEGSPEIVHAATGKNVDHVVASRLPKCTSNFGYIKVQLPDKFNKNFIVALAQSMATHSKRENVIVRYSHKRSEFMKVNLFQQFRYHIDNGTKNPFISTVTDNINHSHEIFTQGGESASWFTPLAKSLNFVRSDFVDSIKRYISKEELEDSLIGSVSKKIPLKFSKYNFSSQGYHCVQFIISILQMSFLLTENELRDYLSLKDIYKDRRHQEQIYFSRKKQGKTIDIFSAIHPKTVIRKNCVKSFKDIFCHNSIAVDGISLSPAGLLWIFYKGFGGIPGHGGTDGFVVSSTFGSVGFYEFQSKVTSLKRQITEVDFATRTTFSRRVENKVNSLIELILVKKVLQYLKQQEIRLEIRRRIMPLIARNIRAETLTNRVRVLRNLDNSEPAPKRARR